MSLLTADPSRIDPEWMTRALRQAGVIKEVRVVDLACKPVGNGLVGDSYRFRLTYDGDQPNAPATVIGKFPAADPASRQSGSAHCFTSAKSRSIASWRPRSPFTPRDRSSPKSIR